MKKLDLRILAGLPLLLIAVSYRDSMVAHLNLNIKNLDEL